MTALPSVGVVKVTWRQMGDYPITCGCCQDDQGTEECRSAMCRFMKTVILGMPLPTIPGPKHYWK